ncbi:DNA primase [bacterium]|nr:DNA primase [bacterium]
MTLFEWVKEQFDIQSVVGEYVKLQRAGTYLKGACPFHSETDASFTVSPDRQIFYCFGCLAGGDLLTFITKVENCSPIQAVQHLVEKNSLEIPEKFKNEFSRGEANGNAKNKYLTACDSFQKWIHDALKRSSIALEYLEDRGITKELIDVFGIGYLPGGVGSAGQLVKELRAKGILLSDLVDTGLFLQGRNIHSPFEERIIFPIRDVIGRCIGFGGRVFRPGDERPKYYNSRESDFFQKRQILFGISAAKTAMQKSERVFLVEGYTDCVAMYKAGFEETVATLGTACTQDHLKLLARFIKRVYMVYDGDKAGKAAVLRIAQNCWEFDLELFVMCIPDGNDPASFIEGGGDMAQLAKSAVDLFTFFVDEVGSDFQAKPLFDKMTVGKRIAAVIARVKNPFKQDILLQQASSVLGLSFGAVKSMMRGEQDSRDTQSSTKDSALPGEEEASLESIEEQVLSIVLNQPVEMDLIDDFVVGCFTPKMQEFLRIWKRVVHTVPREQAFDAFVQEVPGEQNKLLVLRAAMQEHEVNDADFKLLIAGFCRRYWKKAVLGLRADIEKMREGEDYSGMDGLLDSLANLKREMKARGLV